MKSLFVLLTALTAGCALTPAEIRQASAPVKYTLQQAPMRAAACVDRHIENTWSASWGPYNGRVREGAAQGTAELSVPYIVVADFVPAGSGSVAIAYTSPHVMSDAGTLAVEAFKGC